MKRPKRGRPRIGRRAMSGAERQARWRKRKREAEAARLRQQGLEPPRRVYQPPYGYPAAKEKLMEQGHVFTRAHRDAGFEEGVFVDGAFIGSRSVIDLAEMQNSERKRWLDEQRRATKNDACGLVEFYMHALRVSFDDLAHHRSHARSGGRAIPAAVQLDPGHQPSPARAAW